MNLSLEEYGDIPIITVGTKRVDAACAIQFKDAFQKTVPKGRDRVILDLDGVEFVDSSGLGAIVGLMKILAPETKLELSTMGETVKKVFALTRMDQVFTIHERIMDGVRSTKLQ
ncbi:MAG: STAS domain-containing protein [Paracoccaceae bacterium]|nr:STAS domain-containing protein [Paracoccaceae bacterium]MDG2260148.1 STAS domain-containing protein [Paracoccaceae bacterium]